MASSRLRLWSLLVLAAVPQMILSFGVDGPSNGDILTIGSPYALTWDNDNSPSDVCVLAVLRCPRSNAATTLCALVSQSSSLPNSGAYSWTPSTDLNDGEFYRIQLYDTTSGNVATSGTFTFDPFPQDIDTT